MRILVFSDTHRSVSSCIRTIENIIGVDMILHAGDHIDDARELEKAFPDIPVKCVRGNCDFSSGDKELIIEAEGKRIFLTHGHLYAVKHDYDYYTIKKRGEELGCDIIVFGHTHVPINENNGKNILLNPGSAKYTRTFGVIEIGDGKSTAAVLDMNYS